MALNDIGILIAGVVCLWTGYQFLVNRDRQWGRYVERQKGLGVPEEQIIRDAVWERVATFQGVFFTAVGVIALLSRLV